jgi:hypothetical protein
MRTTGRLLRKRSTGIGLLATAAALVLAGTAYGAAAPSGDLATRPPAGKASAASIVRVNQPWTCRGRVDLDLVKVTMRTNVSDAIYLRENCSGRIGRIEVQTWTRDGLKVNAKAPVAHDLVIGGGYIRCYGQVGGHQDGIQAMGGRRITFRNLEVNCNTRVNAQFFVAGIHGAVPTDVVCVSCLLGSGAAQTLFIANSVRSGARSTTICEGRYRAVRFERNPVSPVVSGNTIVPASNPRCHH